MIDAIVDDAFLSQEQQILEIGLNEELVSLFSRALGSNVSDLYSVLLPKVVIVYILIWFHCLKMLRVARK